MTIPKLARLCLSKSLEIKAKLIFEMAQSNPFVAPDHWKENECFSFPAILTLSFDVYSKKAQAIYSRKSFEIPAI